MNTSSILSIPTDDFLTARVQSKLSPAALEVIHKERESYFPLYSSVYAQMSNDKHISITEYVEINTIMRPLEGKDFWNAAFDLMSFFLAESGEL